VTGPAGKGDKRSGLLVWSGFLLPPVVWLSLQQGAGTLVYWHCSQGGPPWAPAAGAAAIAACIGAGLMAWRASYRIESPAQTFIGRVAAGTSVIFALGCLVITAAMLVIPSCAR
jgi:hypothetical protein